MSPETLLRLAQIIGRKASKRYRAQPAIIPVCRTTWWAGVKAGRYPQPIKIGARCVAWRASEIAALSKGTREPAKGGAK
jgi:hypothetical protein